MGLRAAEIAPEEEVPLEAQAALLTLSPDDRPVHERGVTAVDMFERSLLPRNDVPGAFHALARLMSGGTASSASVASA
jgi:hypothetical protein